MHRNPVMRGRVETPEDWMWSSFRHYPRENVESWRSSRGGRRGGVSGWGSALFSKSTNYPALPNAGGIGSGLPGILSSRALGVARRLGCFVQSASQQGNRYIAEFFAPLRFYCLYAFVIRAAYSEALRGQVHDLPASVATQTQEAMTDQRRYTCRIAESLQGAPFERDEP